MSKNQAITHLASQIASEFRKQLEKNNTNATNALYNFNVTTEINGTTYEIYFQLPEYWKYVEYGVNGIEFKKGSPYSFEGKVKPSRRMVDELLTWIRIKPIVPDGRKKITNEQQLAYAIGTSIRKEGIEPRKNLQNALLNVDPYVEEFMNTIGENFATIITDDLRNI